MNRIGEIRMEGGYEEEVFARRRIRERERKVQRKSEGTFAKAPHVMDEVSFAH